MVDFDIEEVANQLRKGPSAQSRAGLGGEFKPETVEAIKPVEPDQPRSGPLPKPEGRVLPAIEPPSVSLPDLSVPPPVQPTRSDDPFYAKSQGSSVKIVWILLVPILILLIAGFVNRFVYSFGFERALPFLAKPEMTEETELGRLSQSSEAEDLAEDETLSAETEENLSGGNLDLESDGPSLDARESEILERDVKRRADLSDLRQALIKYRADFGSYPVAEIVVLTNQASSSLSKALVPKYLSILPLDPLDPVFWYGYQSRLGLDFQLTSILEDEKAPDAIAGQFVRYQAVGDSS